MEALDPHPPRHDGGVEDTILVVHGGAVLERLAVDNLGVDHGVPVGLAVSLLELVEVPGAVHPAGVGPHRVGVGRAVRRGGGGGGGAGGGAGVLAGRLVALEGTAALERTGLAGGGLGGDAAHGGGPERGG